MTASKHQAQAVIRKVHVDSVNGGKTLDQLVEHVSHDGLVLEAWEPGDGRTLPPLPHAEFAARFKEWVDKGAAVPE